MFAVAMGLAGSPIAPRLAPGIPVSGAPQAWGAAVLETLRDNASLPPIRAEDVAQAGAITLGSTHSTAVALGAAHLGADYSITAEPLTPFVQRDLGQVWRLSVPTAARTGNNLRVTTSIESLRGEPGKLSLVGHEEISIPVVLIERVPNVRVANTGARIIEGGVIVQIPSAALQLSGQYSGRLVLRTEGF
jgi:hypothetical protein